jgi:hypothetical protein
MDKETKKKETDAKIIEALRKALEMTTPEKYGIPRDHPDYKRDIEEEKKGSYW